MSKEQFPKLLNKKIKRNNISNSNINEKSENSNGLIIDIKNSLLSIEDLKGNEKNKVLKLNKNKKSEIIKEMERSKIKYTKSKYTISNEVLYKCKKLNNYSTEIIKDQKNCNLLLRLINYNQKNIFFVGYYYLLVYEMFDNDLYLINIFFDKNKDDGIDNIYLLKGDSLSNIIQFFIRIKNKGFLYEFDLKSYKLNLVRDNIILYNEFYFGYKFKFFNDKNKLMIYNDHYLMIYNIIENQFKKLQINTLEEYENIHDVKLLTKDIYIINSDKKLFIFDSFTDSLLFTVETDLRIYWTKILLLINKQFLLYSSTDIVIYDFDYISKSENAKMNRKVKINNIKNIKKIKQLKNKDLIINYYFYNILIYDLKKDIVKYKIINDKIKIDYSNYYCSFLEEVEPNIIAYKNKFCQINFINITKGEILGAFKEENNITIKKFKKINVDYLGIFPKQNNNKMIYFIITNKSAFIIYK